MDELMEQQRTAPAPSGNNQMMINRQAQEVQAAMVIAKKFPRDEFEAAERIKRACQRRSLAGQAVYAYPRGGGSGFPAHLLDLLKHLLRHGGI